jgi:nitroimidazol reductase NimA-like FMN-containing flavoprotein (pyridoxamine 5'-phosphate oxidase superfamily)
LNEQAAAALIRRCSYCVIATATPAGEPWVTPLFFNYDPSLRLYFESEPASRHARLLADNARVAVVISELGASDSIEGVYFEGSAREIVADGLEYALSVLQDGPHQRTRERRTPADYRNDKPLRLYEVVPHAGYGLTHLTLDGNAVERRIDLNLDELRKAL